MTGSSPATQYTKIYRKERKERIQEGERKEDGRDIHKQLEHGHTVCSVCESEELKIFVNLSIKWDVISFLKLGIDIERSIGGREFHKLGKR